jgi:predicted ATP-binding protein involved in virulence
MVQPAKSPAIERIGKEQPVAYFLNLEVENILCFKEKQELKLANHNIPYQWTVILGDNGVGKTTLLRCIAGISMGRVRIASDENGDLVNERLPMFCFPSFFPSIVNWSELKFLYEKNNLIKAHFLSGKKLAEIKKEVDSNTNPIQSYLQVNGFKTFGLKSNAQADFTGLITYSYGATRKVGEATLSDDLQQESCASLFSEKASLINAEEWLLQADYASKSSHDIQKLKILNKIETIKNIFVKTLPDIEDLNFVLDEGLNTRPTVKFKTPYGWIPFSGLGLGYKTMIVWMLDLIIRLYERYPDSEDPLSEPAIVLVDEIDLHLHPKWQRQIISFLTERFPNTQFIVTAHSPLVVQASQDANIVLLRREGDRVVIDNNPEIIDNWRVDQILTSLFELPSARPPQFDDLLERRKEILGKAELTEEDRKELKQIRERIGQMPTGENPDDIHAMDIIRRAAKRLEEQEKSK